MNSGRRQNSNPLHFPRPELTNLEEIQVRIRWVCGHNSCEETSAQFCFLCMDIGKLRSRMQLIVTLDSAAPAAWLPTLWSFPDCAFSPSLHIPGFLHLEDRSGTSVTCSGDNKKHRNMKTDTKQTLKRIRVYLMSTEPEAADCQPGRIQRPSLRFCHSAHAHACD